MKKTMLPIISISAIVTAIACLIMRLICLFNFYDGIGYYKTAAPLPIITNIITVLALVVFLVFAIVFIKPTEKIAAPDKISRYTALFPIAALVIVVIRGVISLSSSEESIDFFTIASIICALISIVFFAFIFLKKNTNATVYCGLGALVFLFFCWMSVYFDFSSPINTVEKILFYVSCAGATLFLFNEICAIYGSVKPKFYYFSIFAAIISIAPSAISALIGSFTNQIKSYNSFEEDVFFTALFVYATIRLIMLLKSRKALVNTDYKEKTAEADPPKSPTNEAPSDETK